MFHVLDLLSQLQSCWKEKQKQKGTKIVLHSQLIPLNFASLEKEKLNTLWISFKKKKKKKEK